MPEIRNAPLGFVVITAAVFCFWRLCIYSEPVSKYVDCDTVITSENYGNFTKHYIPPKEACLDSIGKRLNVTDEMMTSLGIPMAHVTGRLDNQTVTDYVFVTGVSSNHYIESLDTVAGVQKHMPGYRIYYYDLGLTQEQIRKVSSFCNVVYRSFNFSRYPKHVRYLRNYAFKPLIIQDVLQDHRGVVWMDASFRLLKSLTLLYPQIINTGGFLQFWYSPHSNYAVTDQQMFQYLPTDTYRQKQVQSPEASAVWFMMTDKVYWGVFYWWVLCALDDNCIAPKGAQLRCRFQSLDPDLSIYYRSRLYAGCHRFDQAALNILASNLYGYNTDAYTEQKQKVVAINKNPSHMYDIQWCSVAPK